MLWRHCPSVLWALAAATFLCVSLVGAADPKVSATRFHNLPTRLFFFDDSTTLIYHDANEGNIFVSHDEGNQWEKASGIPEGVATMFIEHPFENRYAFVLTKHKKHYRTDDRGKTWRSFEVPLEPAWVSTPLSFHSDPAKYGNILYQGTRCDRTGWWQACHDETYYTKEAFLDTPKLLLSETSRCQFAHSRKEFKHEAHPDLIYCVAFDTETQDGTHSIKSSRLYSSTDYFATENKVEDLGIGKDARGVIALAIVSKFAVVALKDLSPGNNGEMLLYVTVDAKSWAKAQFPHASSARLRENAYTIVESTTHSLGVDVVLEDHRSVGTLFVSNSDGTYFVESLKDTNRNEAGFVDFETLYGVEGVGIANIVSNAQEVETRNAPKKLKSKITFDDGRTWASIQAPSTDVEGKSFGCSPTDIDDCSIHFHSVTLPHNFGRIFSSPAPGFVMGVGSVGPSLRSYEECDTFLSIDAGLTWKMVHKDAHLYEFGDQGSIMVIVNDEDGVDSVRYSTDLGKTWRTQTLGVTMRARALTTVPDSTSQKFVLIGQLSRKDKTTEGGFISIFLDFAPTRSNQCRESDLEKWYARGAKGKECLMGHQQWYMRRKADADCYVGNKFKDPEEHEDNCPCEDSDYECDFNYVRNGGDCVPLGPEPIPEGVCTTGDPNQKYSGSSGFRLIPGNTCDRARGSKKDEPKEKKCSQAAPPEGEVTHQTFKFQSAVIQQQYFKDSDTILVLLADNTAWQSSNEGYTWQHLKHDERIVVFFMHHYSNDRAYLITDQKKFYYTTDTGKSWHTMTTPTVPNIFGVPALNFHPQKSDNLIWTGSEGCTNGQSGNCHAEAHYSRDNGRNWTPVDTYVRNCQWARDSDLKVDPSQIICESYKEKKGLQPRYPTAMNAPELISGMDYYRKKNKVFDAVIGYAKFSEYLVVAEVQSSSSLDLQVSLDGRTFATGMFPPSMKPEQHAYTILESSTDSLFVHVTMSEAPHPFWGNILKSNSNGTYFGVSAENVNRDERGYVDFEKMIGLDGIALINVVSNTEDATHTGLKKLQSRITHNDGGSWKPLTPPSTDSMGHAYDCKSVTCALQVHGYTERFDPRATYSTPSVPGLIMAVGNVGENLMPYTDSDTFLSRDGGFTWEEVHKDAHLWEFGDSGSILVMANDEVATDHVLFTTDEGKTWREYKFTNDEKVRVRSIMTVPSDTSRRFILFGEIMRGSMSVAIQIDFTSLTKQKCVFSVDEPGKDDFELWSPSEERTEQCLFGRQTIYQRRKREKNCVVGGLAKAEEKFVKNCACNDSDFECEYNYRRVDGQCVLIEDHEPLANDPDDQCRGGAEYWYERTAYRKIAHSSCEGGSRPDRGAQHACPGLVARSAAFWWTVALVPFAVAGAAAWWYRRTRSAGPIRLPGGGEMAYRPGAATGALETLASVPWFLVGLASVAWERVSSMRGARRGWAPQRGYRHVPVDEDARILRFEDEE